MWKNLLNGEEPEVGTNVLVYNPINDEYKVMGVYRSKSDGKICFSNNPNIFPKTTGAYWMELPEPPDVKLPDESNFLEEMKKLKEEKTEQVYNKLTKAVEDELINFNFTTQIKPFSNEEIEKVREMIQKSPIFPIPDTAIYKGVDKKISFNINYSNGFLTIYDNKFNVISAVINTDTIFPTGGEIICQLTDEQADYISNWLKIIQDNATRQLENLDKKYLADMKKLGEFFDWDKYCIIHGFINARKTRYDSEDGTSFELLGVHPLSVSHDDVKGNKVVFSYDLANRVYEEEEFH